MSIKLKANSDGTSELLNNADLVLKFGSDNYPYDKDGNRLGISELSDSDGSGKVGFLQSGTGAVARTAQAKLRDVVSVKDFGAVGDGVTDDTAAISSWITYLMTSGKMGFVPAGTYYMASALTVSVTGDVDIHCSNRATFKGGSTINSVMILFLASTKEAYQVSWAGGTFDISETAFVASELSGGGLGLQKVWKSVVSGVRFVGPVDYMTGGDFGGDSGLTIVDCRFVTVSNCFFSGMRDLGIYITGNGDPTEGDGDGGDIIVSQSHFVKCNSGVSVKRQTARVHITANSFYKCYRGAMMDNVGGVTPAPFSGHSCAITNNLFSYTAKNPIRATNTKNLLVANNRIQDFGYSYDDTTTISSPAGILLEGAENSLINANWIGMQDWALTGSTVGIISQSFTYDAVAIKCINNTVANNHMTLLDIGVRETPETAKYNIYQGNIFVTVADEYNSIQALSKKIEYSTGEWTVSLYDAASGGNQSPTTATGYYTKIGGLVTATFSINNIDTTGMTGTSPLYISLPFASKAGMGAAGSVVTDNIVFPTGKTGPTLALSGGTSRALISTTGTGVADGAVLVSGVNSGAGDIVLATITYMAAEN